MNTFRLLLILAACLAIAASRIRRRIHDLPRGAAQVDITPTTLPRDQQRRFPGTYGRPGPRPLDVASVDLG